MMMTSIRNGYICNGDNSYEHTVVAEKKLGRKLGKTEVVHHKDEIKTNNDPDNLLVLRSQADHRLIHCNIPVEVFETKDGSSVVIKQQRECPHCKLLFEPGNNSVVFCSFDCHAKNKIKRIPTAEKLKELVWSKPMVHLAKDLAVSDVAIAKWCKKRGVETPPKGYWEKNKSVTS